MLRNATYAALGLLAIATVALVGGCPTTPNTDGTDTDTSQLSAAEADAVIASLSSAETFVSTTAAATSTTNIEDVDQQAQSSATVPVTTNSDGDVVFGNCPQVTINADSSTATSSTIGVDFGDGCNPAGNASFACAGTAMGTISVLTRSLSLSFDDFTCGMATISGEVDLDYERGTDTVQLSGSWDLRYTAEGTDVTTDGAGTVSYSPEDDAATVNTFTGTITDGTTDYAATLTNVQVSYTTNQNFIPFAGEAGLSGDDIRTLNVRFNSETPTTHVVEISINGSEFFEVDLDEI